MKATHTITPVFDDPNLVSAAGLVPVMRLAETADLHGLFGRQLSVVSVGVGSDQVLIDTFGDLDIDVLLVGEHRRESRFLLVGTQRLTGQQNPFDGSSTLSGQPLSGAFSRV